MRRKTNRTIVETVWKNAWKIAVGLASGLAIIFGSLKDATQFFLDLFLNRLPSVDEITQIQITLIAVGSVIGGLLLWHTLRTRKGAAKETSESQPKVFPNGVAIGDPMQVRKGVYRYRQKDAPPILDMIDSTNKDVGALLVGGHFLTTLIDRDYERITKEKSLTLCLQPEGSPILAAQSRQTGSPDLGDKIHVTMELLRKRRREITKKENLIIRTHEQYLSHSIMVFDADDERGCVRVVEYSHEPQDDWDTRIVFKNGNKKEYEKYLSEYRNVIQNLSREVSLD